MTPVCDAGTATAATPAPAGSHSAGSLATAPSCSPIEVGTVGLCSDHRILTGTVTLK